MIDIGLHRTADPATATLRLAPPAARPVRTWIVPGMATLLTACLSTVAGLWLGTRRPTPYPDTPPTAQRRLMNDDNPVEVEAHAVITSSCPMLYDTDTENTHFEFGHPTTFQYLTFTDQALLDFVRLGNQAVREMRQKRELPLPNWIGTE